MTERNRKSNTIIIGASGFIGSNLTRKLLKKGHYVTAIIGEYGLQYLGGIKDRRLKIYSSNEVENNLKKMGRFSFLFNLSGYIDIGESFIKPLKYEMNKPITTIKLIEDCRTEKFINISTANVYDFTCNPLSEKSPIGPASPYAITQLSADYYTQVLCDHHKVPYLILRLFNPYGPPNKKRGVIATIINELLEGHAVTLYNPYRKFDFTYIDDITEAVNFCAVKLKGIINIGCGRPVSLLEVYRKISFLLYKNYKEPSIVISDKHREEVFANSNKLKMSGFKFKYSINEGLRQTVKYFQESIDRV
ncbi:MAG: NAD-dependent epimerase/dehydratase family protein [Candidatus Omnitrophota bacterium]|nr:NAD-dependent epimerase/dehydratase family protein [Candidatus Omnitrophota bacterium]